MDRGASLRTHRRAAAPASDALSRARPRAHAFSNQLGPLKRLHTDEGGAKRCSGADQPERFGLVPAIAVIHCHCHGARARNEHEGHPVFCDDNNINLRLFS